MTRTPRRKKKKRQATIHNCDRNAIEFLPGDVCFILRPPNTNMVTDIGAVFIASLLPQGRGNSAEHPIWIEEEEILRWKNGSSIQLHAIWTCKISLVPRWDSSHGFPPTQHTARLSGNKGTLRDKTPYVICRFALYADGFK